MFYLQSDIVNLLWSNIKTKLSNYCMQFMKKVCCWKYK